MLIAWMISFIYQAYWAVVSTVVDGKCEPHWVNKAVQTFFGIMTFFVEYLIPLVLMTFAYASIISRLGQRCRVTVQCESRSNTMNTIGNKSETKTRGTTRTNIRQPKPPRSINSTNARMYMFSEAKRNVAKTLCVVFATYVLCWTPTELEYLVYNLGGPLDFTGSVHRVTVILVLCNMCVNPIIYALKYQEFQENLKQMLVRLIDKLRRRNSRQRGPEEQGFSLIKLSPSPNHPRRIHHQADNLAMSDES